MTLTDLHIAKFYEHHADEIERQILESPTDCSFVIGMVDLLDIGEYDLNEVVYNFPVFQWIYSMKERRFISLGGVPLKLFG